MREWAVSLMTFLREQGLTWLRRTPIKDSVKAQSVTYSTKAFVRTRRPWNTWVDAQGWTRCARTLSGLRGLGAPRNALGVEAHIHSGDNLHDVVGHGGLGRYPAHEEAVY